MFRKILIANRGEIAERVIRTARRMGIATVAVYSDADRFARPTLLADESVRIGPEPAALSYLDAAAILRACRQSGAEAVHPGYGFLSENADFVETLEAAGICFIGPSADSMRRFGLKHSARSIAAQVGVPLLPGSALLTDLDEAVLAARSIGYPIMLKSTAGGGGIGIQLCRDAAELRERFATVQRLSENNFGDGRVYLEKFIGRARHVEVQVFGDGAGGVVALGERDCSLQRRHQKVIEETPAPGLSAATRARMQAAAVTLAAAVQYRSAGTVEFIYDAHGAAFYFLEVNTRLQVEHGVTEMVFGIDLVEWMIREAAGAFVLPPQESLRSSGAAIEARLYAENPSRGFQPNTGLLTHVRFPDTVRVDGWIETGSTVTPYYDPLLAKLIARGDSREQAVATLREALRGSAIWGIETNLAYLDAALGLPDFVEGAMTTATLGGFDFASDDVEVLAAGTQTSLQDWPGRIGYWSVGVPPSGPMDDVSFRLANRIVGNDPGAPALEITLTGPTLRFHGAAVLALAGATIAAELDGQVMPPLVPVTVRPGQVLTLGDIPGPGSRAYLAVRHGFDAPAFLGSRSTFALGGFGGHATGWVRLGDVLRVCASGAITAPDATLSAEAPAIETVWEIGVLAGPHAAPDFFTEEDIRALLTHDYKVHHNSARTGVRLIGPKPQWAREDGGEAGLHPSNIHDNAYAVGAIDFTGDMPIILGPDGPSLGGFVCPAVVVLDELWKVGQLRPGDSVRFIARDLSAVTGLPAPVTIGAPALPQGVLRRRDVQKEGEVAVCYRIAGDDNVLVEYGPLVLDIALRLRVHSLHQALIASSIPGLLDLTPGIRSLQVHFDPARLSLGRLLDRLEAIEAQLPPTGEIVVPSRILHLPLSCDDDQARLAARRYQELVRPDAPWCPSNIEFIRRINGLDDEAAVRRIVFDASYLVLGLGDVYLGAPVATPIDPRHRLVTTKYNPARTWTPQNAVGIGGAYLCIYGMEGPGGYQLVGRTIQVWNSWRSTGAFQPGKPWLLDFFDQIRFFPVSREELEEARAAFPHGRYTLRTEMTTFGARDYAAFLVREAPSIAAFKARQQEAFEAERRRWKEHGHDRETELAEPDPPPPADALPAGTVGVHSPIPGSVWKLEAVPGERVDHGQTLLILEAMKTEMRIQAPVAGMLEALLCQPGQPVSHGQRVAIIRPESERMETPA